MLLWHFKVILCCFTNIETLTSVDFMLGDIVSEIAFILGKKGEEKVTVR